MARDRDDPDGPSRRQVARRERRDAGDRSAHLARALMAAPESTIRKLALDDDVAADVARARAITSHVARRRAERNLAGELRRADVGAIATRLRTIQDTGAADQRHFHLAETWRTRLLDDDGAQAAFVVAFPAVAAGELAAWVAAARSERDRGRPPGAARALFRHVAAALAAAAGTASAETP